MTKQAHKKFGRNSVFGRLQETMQKQIIEQQQIAEFCVLIQELKFEVLENLLAEQDFRIYLNSIDNNERALNLFCE